jgi:hypothetical protein
VLAENLYSLGAGGAIRLCARSSAEGQSDRGTCFARRGRLINRRVHRSRANLLAPAAHENKLHAARLLARCVIHLHFYEVVSAKRQGPARVAFVQHAASTKATRRNAHILENTNTSNGTKSQNFSLEFCCEAKNTTPFL